MDKKNIWRVFWYLATVAIVFYIGYSAGRKYESCEIRKEAAMQQAVIEAKREAERARELWRESRRAEREEWMLEREEASLVWEKRKDIHNELWKFAEEETDPERELKLKKIAISIAFEEVE